MLGMAGPQFKTQAHPGAPEGTEEQTLKAAPKPLEKLPGVEMTRHIRASLPATSIQLKSESIAARLTPALVDKFNALKPQDKARVIFTINQV